MFILHVSKIWRIAEIVVLLNNEKQETLHFYEKAGYNSSDKTAFVQWIGMDK